MNAYTPYEQMSLREARATFADPFRTPVSALVHVVGQDRPGGGAERASARGARRIPRQMTRAVGRALDGLLDAMLRTLSARKALADYRREHGRVRAIADLRRLELWEIDEVAERLPARYIAASAALGIAVGPFGAVGLLVDAPLVAGLASRAIGDVALRYGFDPRAPEERRFARDVLIAALTPAASVRAASIDELLAACVAGARALRKNRGAPLLLRLARGVLRVGLSREQRASLARVGSVAAAAVNAWLLVGVIRAARSAYRERFLARKAAG